MTAAPLLTIAIPTWNRAAYLEQNLAQLAAEMRGVAAGQVEVLVSDNHSTDGTPGVVESAQRAGLAIRYVRNAENLGWGRNFAQCFELASGRYLLLLGDDDLLTDGALRLLVDRLGRAEYGVVCLGAYGFDSDFRAEYPGDHGGEREFTDANEFLIGVGALATLISSCVVNKTLLSGVDGRQYASGDLAFLPLVLRAALAARRNLYLTKFLIASKRANSFSYEFSAVFVTEMWRLYDERVGSGLEAATVRKIERDLLLSYYPYYLLDLRVAKRSDPRVALANFRRRFGGQWLFEIWLAPTLSLPRPLAILWGGATTIVGRILHGEWRLGFAFLRSRFKRSNARKVLRNTPRLPADS
jgi:glycosyltransferase involved in cell wall biosynthesis